MPNYHGHNSRSAWNVSLWINNDEGLYNLARSCIRRTKNRDEAAKLMLSYLEESGTARTPDGYGYTKTTIRAAMVGM
jgi:hypothetical protein